MSRLRSFGFAAYCRINGAGPHECEDGCGAMMTDDASCLDLGHSVVCRECADAQSDDCDDLDDLDVAPDNVSAEDRYTRRAEAGFGE